MAGILSPLRGQLVVVTFPWNTPTGGIPPSLRDSNGPATATRFCTFFHGIVGFVRLAHSTHGWDTVIAMRFKRSSPRDAVRLVVVTFPWVTPTAGVLPPRRGSIGCCYDSVGCHPRLGYGLPWVVTHGWGIVTTTWFYSATSSKKTVGPSCKAAVSMVMSVTISRLARGSS